MRGRGERGCKRKKGGALCAAKVKGSEVKVDGKAATAVVAAAAAAPI